MTDIEGSTRLWETEPEVMRRALLRHDAIVRACIQGRRGHVVKSQGEGDSIFAVFPHVRDAVSAALIAQCALAVERWATSRPLRVPRAIHTGQIEGTTTARRSTAARGCGHSLKVTRFCYRGSPPS